MTSSRWLNHIHGIEVKGYEAFEHGKSITDCPYQDGYRNSQGEGGQFQRQRREAWVRGWKLAKREASPPYRSPDHDRQIGDDTADIQNVSDK